MTSWESTVDFRALGLDGQAGKMLCDGLKQKGYRKGRKEIPSAVLLFRPLRILLCELAVMFFLPFRSSLLPRRIIVARTLEDYQAQ
jgi:hypothetical protein